ncbi:2-oxoacid:acceptor oxidoreductase subunit alpha [Desulfovibrio inopinatus]|uniref:2-oxoacid:acceptor oxidoreductase subunit alpha n=1 Tax=Desulfovibrio inopinatus TaxID=102109 RepID=UPI0003FD84E2|nr:2-oxoacid:acceptor oxidoreductase subunit alpha [Desulfovibrio inopinatus]
MSDTSVNIVIGGEAGQGLVTVGDFLSKALVRAGYEIVVSQDYMSRVRGGHNTYAIRTSPDPVLAPKDEIDILVALNAETVSLHSDALSERAVVLADESVSFESKRRLKVPFKELIPKTIFENTAALGILAQLLCLEKTWFHRLIEETFSKKGKEIVQQNIDVFEGAFAWSQENDVSFECIAPATRTEKRLRLHGNEAIALGALAAGVNFCSFYPMTPSTSIALNLIAKGERMGLVAEQAEDEIAAVNMALGASFAGACVLVPTSGGGFALMTEGVSLAGMTETPVVFALAMRPGPATGLPTRTAQSDLNLVLYAGHGDFVRAIFTPGDIEECFYLTWKAVDLAERVQSPMFILTDQFLADSYRAVAPFDLDSLADVTKPDLSEEPDSNYMRYAMTKNGVSPRKLPGFGEFLVIADSDEHTQDGHITEDLAVAVDMADKRMRKMDILKEVIVPPTLDGDDIPELLLVCFGSTKGAALEAASMLREAGGKVAVIHFSQVYPLDSAHFLDVFESADRVVFVEGNVTGQFADLVRKETGFEADDRILRYDGLPFTAAYIIDRLEATR